jgi:hypothetical protein
MDDRSDPLNNNAPPARYDRDLYSWAVEQAALLRSGRVEEVDALNIAEEIDDVGTKQYDKLENALQLILLHLLKWDHQAERRSRSWWASIQIQRKHAEKVLRKNPGLKPQVEEAIGDGYGVARLEAAKQTKLDPRAFPEQCCYSWDEIMQRPIEWPARD